MACASRQAPTCSAHFTQTLMPRTGLALCRNHPVRRTLQHCSGQPQRMPGGTGGQANCSDASTATVRSGSKPPAPCPEPLIRAAAVLRLACPPIGLWRRLRETFLASAEDDSFGGGHMGELGRGGTPRRRTPVPPVTGSAPWQSLDRAPSKQLGCGCVPTYQRNTRLRPSLWITPDEEQLGHNRAKPSPQGVSEDPTGACCAHAMVPLLAACWRCCHARAWRTQVCATREKLHPVLCPL